MEYIKKLDYAIDRIQFQIDDIKSKIEPNLKRVTINERAGRGTDQWLLEELEEQGKKLDALESMLKQLQKRHNKQFDLLINELLIQR